MHAPEPTWVLVRGLMRDQRHWGDFLPLLRQHWPKQHFQAIDIAGNGTLHQQPSPIRIAAMTEQLRAELIAPIRLTGVIAISMGGMIALDWMTRYPDEINHAVLINTSIRPYAPFYWRLQPARYPMLLRLLSSSYLERERLILALTANTQGHNASVLQQWQTFQTQAPVSRINALRQLYAAARFQLTAPPPKQPLLLLASRKDRLVDFRCSRALQQAWHVPLVLHPKAGHDLTLDDPHWVIEQMATWRQAL
ncbi:MAG: alpha/beta hydrolase [Methylococcales bacterium]|nr:alpha/beta hydrolase [Methylococcales bacterium]